MALAMVLCLATSLAVCAKTQSDSCFLRSLNFTAFVEDKNGFKCQQKISTVACFGTCETTEYGTHTFPHKAGSQVGCNFEQAQQRVVSLSDCESGFDSKARKYVYTEALSCSCTMCNQKTTNCVTAVRSKAKRLGGRIGMYGSVGGGHGQRQPQEEVLPPTNRMGGSYDWRKPMKVATRMRLLTRQGPLTDNE